MIDGGREVATRPHGSAATVALGVLAATMAPILLAVLTQATGYGSDAPHEWTRELAALARFAALGAACALVTRQLGGAEARPSERMPSAPRQPASS